MQRPTQFLRRYACTLNVQLHVEVALPGTLCHQRRDVQVGDLEGAIIAQRRGGHIDLALERHAPGGGTELTAHLQRLGWALRLQVEVHLTLQGGVVH